MDFSKIKVVAMDLDGTLTQHKQPLTHEVKAALDALSARYKFAFDPDRKRRRKIYPEVVEAFPEYKVFVGGSSSFDMSPAPYDKYYALDLWATEEGFSHEEVAYIGDDYGQGGNDEVVYLSDFPYLKINDYRTFPEIVAPLLK